MPTPHRVSIRIPSEFEHLILARRVLAAVCEDTPLSSEMTTQIGICLIEAAGNSIRHAYDLDPDHEVEINAELHADRLVIEIIDWGKSMPESARRLLKDGDPLADPPASDIQDIPETGMGFPILRTVLDELEYSSADGRNVLTLTKRFATADAVK